MKGGWRGTVAFHVFIVLSGFLLNNRRKQTESTRGLAPWNSTLVHYSFKGYETEFTALLLLSGDVCTICARNLWEIKIVTERNITPNSFFVMTSNYYYFLL